MTMYLQVSVVLNCDVHTFHSICLFAYRRLNYAEMEQNKGDVVVPENTTRHDRKEETSIKSKTCLFFNTRLSA